MASLFEQFGDVRHSTVRVKPGNNKSWALITFKEIASAEKCIDEVRSHQCASCRLVIMSACFHASICHLVFLYLSSFARVLVCSCARVLVCPCHIISPTHYHIRKHIE